MNLSDLNPLVAIGGKILDRVLPDPVAAEKAKAELAQLEQTGELARMANEAKMYEKHGGGDRAHGDGGGYTRARGAAE